VAYSFGITKKHGRVYITHILDYLQFDTIALNNQKQLFWAELKMMWSGTEMISVHNSRT